MKGEITSVYLDLDLTSIDENSLLYPGLASVLDSARRDFAMTIFTGRGFPRYMEAVEKNPDLVVSPNMPVALEHGARVVNSEHENVHYSPLPDGDIDQIIDYINAEPISSVSFYPKYTHAPTVMWSAGEPKQLKLGDAYRKNITFLQDKNDLFREMREQKPCTVTCRVLEGHPQNIPDSLNFYTRAKNVNFLPHGVDKGVAANIIADMTHTPLEHVLAAGNDYNDIPVLTLPNLGQPVLVGHDLPREKRLSLPEKTIWVPHHHNLGNFIYKSTRRPGEK